MHNYREKFWKTRSKCYEKLEWATKSGYLHSFLDAGRFKKNDVVLDIGTGTGIIAHTISPHVKKTIGIDISQAMLDHALAHQVSNEIFMKCDARKLPFCDNKFSKITARMVFHHILENTHKAMSECYRVLAKDGWMIFSEGVPPTEYVKNFYTEMFKLKEERLTFMDYDMKELMEKAGFKILDEVIHWNRKSSIKNWLENSGLNKETQEKIFKMHLNLDSQSRKDYKMIIKRGDCLIDMKFVILIGKK